MKPQEINLDSDMLTNFREQLSELITATVRELMNRNLSSGSVSGKINLEIVEKANVETGEMVKQLIVAPEVSTRIGAKGKAKCGIYGALLSKDRDGIPIVASNQIDIDELLQEKEGA